MLSSCLAACVALLAIYCAVQARLHTETTVRTGGPGTSGTPSPGATTSTYNSSAAAVSGIWLFFEIWIINTMRARNPQLMIPGIIATIFANVSMVYAPQFASMATGISFVKRLLESFFTGFAIGGAVSLLIFPMTMRGVVFKEFTGYIMLLRKMTKANLTYLQSLEEGDMFFGRSDTNVPEKPKRTSEAQAIKDTLAGLAALHGKLSIDLTFAKREVAIGRLGPDDLQEIFKQLRGLMLPIIGLSSVIDVFERIAEDRDWNHPAPKKPFEELDDPNERSRMEAVQDWHAIFKTMREPFARIVGDIDEGFEHGLLVAERGERFRRRARIGDERLPFAVVTEAGGLQHGLHPGECRLKDLPEQGRAVIEGRHVRRPAEHFRHVGGAGDEDRVLRKHGRAISSVADEASTAAPHLIFF